MAQLHQAFRTLTAIVVSCAKDVKLLLRKFLCASKVSLSTESKAESCEGKEVFICFAHIKLNLVIELRESKLLVTYDQDTFQKPMGWHMCWDRRFCCNEIPFPQDTAKLLSGDKNNFACPKCTFFWFYEFLFHPLCQNV